MKFDVIVGNPPYNSGIDLKFVKKIVEDVDPEHMVLVHPSTYLIDRKMKYGPFVKARTTLEGKLRSADLFNGNKIFGIGLFVPCVVIHYDRDYNGLTKVNYFGEEYTADVWNITKFGSAWEPIVKPFMEKMREVCDGGNSVWDNRIGKDDVV